MRRSRRTDLLSESCVCQLHRRLFGEVWLWAGTFRRTGKNIGVDPLYIAAELRTLLDDMKYWFNNETYPPLEAIIRFHHRLTAIHPFPNGNGRHARIMADALLIKLYKLSAIDWAGGHDLASMNNRRKSYIQALQAADRGDYGAPVRICGYRSIGLIRTQQKNLGILPVKVLLGIRTHAAFWQQNHLLPSQHPRLITPSRYRKQVAGVTGCPFLGICSRGSSSSIRRFPLATRRTLQARGPRVSLPRQP